MLEWCKEKFEGYCNVSIVLVYILCPIAFGLMRKTIAFSSGVPSGLLIFLGAIIGLVVAICLNTGYFGFIGLIMDIRDEIKNINRRGYEGEDNLKKISEIQARRLILNVQKFLQMNTPYIFIKMD